MQRSNAGFYAMAAVLLTVASFLYSWKFIVPNYQKNSENLAKTEKEIELAKVKLESLQTTKNSLDQLGDVVNKLFIAVPKDENSPDLITEIEALAAKSQIIIPSIQISNDGSGSVSGQQSSGSVAAPTSSASSISVSFSASSSFENLSQLISSLEKDIRFTNVKSITLTASPDNKTTTLAIQFEVYKRGTLASSAQGYSVSLNSTDTTSGSSGSKEVQ